jgi:hypothetical protein
MPTVYLFNRTILIYNVLQSFERSMLPGAWEMRSLRCADCTDLSNL